MARDQISDDAIYEILDMSVDGELPRPEKTIKELAEALGEAPDRILFKSFPK